MKQILWFRRDLRITDSALLAHATGEVLPIFIFDEHILKNLPKEDKRVTFIYESVLALKKQLQTLGLDLAIFYGKPEEIFKELIRQGFDEVLCSIDYDAYAIQRDKTIESILPMHRFLDSFILEPNEHLKKDGTPYKVFTPFYKALEPLHSALHLEEYQFSNACSKASFDYDNVPTLEELGFVKTTLPAFLYQSAQELLEAFSLKMALYEKERDFFYIDATSKLSVHLRFGLISPKEIFNYVKTLAPTSGAACFIKELFWREFYNYILYHFPYSEFENFNGQNLQWSNSDEAYEKWCNAQTGVPIVDAAMRCLNETGCMHNRLRMIVASFATKNLLIPWKRCEAYFALKLLDYEACSNVGSWQWAASTGADSVPYFRLFNPYLQSKKFDKEGQFIKHYLPELKECDARLFHIENGLKQNLFLEYPPLLVGIAYSRERALQFYKRVNTTKL